MVLTLQTELVHHIRRRRLGQFASNPIRHLCLVQFRISLGYSQSRQVGLLLGLISILHRLLRLVKVALRHALPGHLKSVLDLAFPLSSAAVPHPHHVRSLPLHSSFIVVRGVMTLLTLLPCQESFDVLPLGT